VLPNSRVVRYRPPLSGRPRHVDPHRPLLPGDEAVRPPVVVPHPRRQHVPRSGPHGRERAEGTAQSLQRWPAPPALLPKAKVLQLRLVLCGLHVQHRWHVGADSGPDLEIVPTLAAPVPPERSPNASGTAEDASHARPALAPRGAGRTDVTPHA